MTSCGSGLSAAILTLGLNVAGLPEGALYDGSWTKSGCSLRHARRDRPGLSAGNVRDLANDNNSPNRSKVFGGLSHGK